MMTRSFIATNHNAAHTFSARFGLPLSGYTYDGDELENGDYRCTTDDDNDGDDDDGHFSTKASRLTLL